LEEHLDYFKDSNGYGVGACKEARESVEELGRSAGKKLDQAEKIQGTRSVRRLVRSLDRSQKFRAIDNLATGARIVWMLRRHLSKIMT